LSFRLQSLFEKLKWSGKKYCEDPDFEDSWLERTMRQKAVDHEDQPYVCVLSIIAKTKSQRILRPGPDKITSLVFFRQKRPFSKPPRPGLIFTDFKDFWYSIFWDQYQWAPRGCSKFHLKNDHSTLLCIPH
jgi:hypothetical protein